MPLQGGDVLLFSAERHNAGGVYRGQVYVQRFWDQVFNRAGRRAHYQHRAIAPNAIPYLASHMDQLGRIIERQAPGGHRCSHLAKAVSHDELRTDALRSPIC